MAYDHALADRVRDRLAGETAIDERAMFGGLAFLFHGNMAVGISGDDLMVRVGPDASDAALARPHTRVFDMTGRPMKGWIIVEPAGFESDDELAEWVRQGVGFAGSLPAKG
jgi:TfoX/Sxy family transcriptional regulator of competence genes